MDITIRDATPEDAEATEQVRYKTWLATYPNEEFGITKEDIEKGFEGRFTEGGLAKRKKKIAEATEKGRFVVAESSRAVVGFCLLVRYEEKNQLRGIYLLPEYQGHGLGTRLWNAVAGARDPQKDTYVETAAYNDPAIHFYSKLGFRDTGRRMNHAFEGVQGKVIPEMEMVLKATPEGDD